MDWTQLNWHPQIGDPHFMGWATVLAYACCAWASFGIYRNASLYFDDSVARQRSFWALMMLAMTLLAINKQLDLQTLLTEVGRLIAKEHGWYKSRHTVQRIFITAMTGGSLMVASALAFYYRKVLLTNRLALIGATFVIAFVLVRAASFHHVDRLLGVHIAGLKVNWLLEWFGLVLIFINARHIKSKGKSAVSKQ